VKMLLSGCRAISAALLLGLCAASHAQPAPQKITVRLDPALTGIHWTLSDVLHTVHGSFRLKSGLVTFDPATGAAQGEIIVDVAGGESGNQSRDSRMHRDVLESGKYPQAIFHPVKVTGAVKPGSTQNVTVEGTITIHGIDRPLTLEMKVEVNGSDAVASTHFTIPYVAWGMKDPSTFVLRVGKEVDVDVTAKGAIDGLQ
jgi:polyisoprenoid-binding protein YceI